MSLSSPARRVLYEANPNYYAFGNTPAHNALEGFGSNLDESGVLKVLFLGCGDLRNPLTAVTLSGHCGNLQIHVNDNSLPVIARDILILKIISSPKFNPDDEEDMAYVWDVWYNATWPQSTLDRFLQDVKSLLNETLPDNIVIPKRSYKGDLEELWTFWLSATKSFTCKKILEERQNFMRAGFTKITLGRQSSGTMSFSETVDAAVQRVERTLIAFGNISNSPCPFPTVSTQQLLGKIRQEVEEYFKKGFNCAAGRMASSSVNPTMLQPVTGKWIVHYGACPLEGYLPIPLNEMENSSSKNDGGIVIAYGRNELKKLFMAFRMKRMGMVQFFFHPCDALAFCYEDSTGGFDVIDTSNLTDHIGLINLLNAVTRKLRSDQSVLLTESMKWTNVAQDLAQYVQEVLCCHLTLILTLYGLRLKDDIQLGPEFPSPIDINGITGLTSRLRWKKALLFDGVPLALSPTLEQILERLKTACFFPGSDSSAGSSSALQFYNSPLTFHYVLSDLIRRGGSPTLLDCAFLVSLPPAGGLLCERRAVRRGVETIQAWMVEEQLVDIWQVEVSMPFNAMDQHMYESTWSSRCKDPVLRLVLVPTSKYFAAAVEGPLALNGVMEFGERKVEGHCTIQHAEHSVRWLSIFQRQGLRCDSVDLRSG